MLLIVRLIWDQLLLVVEWNQNPSSSLTPPAGNNGGSDAGSQLRRHHRSVFCTIAAMFRTYSISAILLAMSKSGRLQLSNHCRDGQQKSTPCPESQSHEPPVPPRLYLF